MSKAHDYKLKDPKINELVNRLCFRTDCTLLLLNVILSLLCQVYFLGKMSYFVGKCFYVENIGYLCLPEEHKNMPGSYLKILFIWPSIIYTEICLMCFSFILSASVYIMRKQA